VACSGRQEISIHPYSGGRHSFVTNFGNTKEIVEITTLDSCNFSDRGFLWIDTEGYELEVLKGAQNYLKENADGICVEITPDCHSSEQLDFLNDILRSNFSKFRTLDGQIHLSPDQFDFWKCGIQADLFCLK